jgi:hypothetical protein
MKLARHSTDSLINHQYQSNTILIWYNLQINFIYDIWKYIGSRITKVSIVGSLLLRSLKSFRKDEENTKNKQISVAMEIQFANISFMP